MKLRILAAFVASSLACVAAAAYGQATRTFVSGVGNDADPCSRTAPCRTFAGAFTKTAAGGEINCLDPGGYGGLTINKRITIRCDYTEGGALVAGAGVNGITINLPAVTDQVVLSGIDFNGVGTATNGLRIITGGIVLVQNSVVHDFRAASGLGIRVAPAGILNLTVKDTTVTNNGSGATGGGILVQPTGAGGAARVSLINVTVQGNANNGLFVNTTGNTNVTNGITVAIENSSFTDNATGIRGLRVGGTNTMAMMVNNSLIANNSTVGIITDGGQTTIRVGNSTITGNPLGVSPLNGGLIQSFGNNRLLGNPTIGPANNGAFSGAVLPES
jgi:hypothetical protein